MTSLALALCLSSFTDGHAQRYSPFGRLAGHWSGNGTIELNTGAHERIRCRAAYDVLDQLQELQLNIRCASDSFNFDLRSSAHYSEGAITGSWSESTRGVAGTIAGRASRERFEVEATAIGFSASLTLVTHGDRQSVVIQSQVPDSPVKRASIRLRRSG